MNNQYNTNDVCAIVVVFKPNLKEFKKNFNQLVRNFRNVIVVINDESLPYLDLDDEKSLVIDNKKNFGLAKALNQGVSLAKKKAFKIAAFFDQDTLIPDDYNKKMLSNIDLFNKKEPHSNVATFSSQFVNKKTNQKSQVINISILRFITKNTSLHNFYDFPSWVITSGCYIPLKVFDSLDNFDENLFIDYIDIEWCLRAQKYGYCCVLFNNINFVHDLGDSYIPFAGRYLYTHSPLRVYYSSRNSFYLFGLEHISLNFFITDQIRNILKFFIFLVISKNKSNLVKFFFLGLYHGLIKKMGKLEE